jgi:hypothetical protein
MDRFGRHIPKQASHHRDLLSPDLDSIHLKCFHVVVHSHNLSRRTKLAISNPFICPLPVTPRNKEKQPQN